jgi:hypothetical protein
MSLIPPMAAIAGALWGIFIGDALAMPAHWYYDVELLKEDYGTIGHYVAPKPKHATNFIMHGPGLVFPSTCSVVDMFTCLARFQEGTELSYEKDTTQVAPEVGPTSAFYRCITTGMRGPTSIFWANPTPSRLWVRPGTRSGSKTSTTSKTWSGCTSTSAAARTAPTTEVAASPERCSYSDTALYIPLVITHTEYTGWRQNDFNVHG